MGLFEKWLSLWVVISIIVGIALGYFFPSVLQGIAHLEYASVNFVVAIFIWVMIYPMMINIDFTSLMNIKRQPKGLVITLVINWLIKPFTMTLLGILFFKYIFASFVDPKMASSYISGMILLGVAPCTAMVFVWSQLVKGDANYTLVQVSINDILMIFLFAPIASFLLGMTNVNIPWDTLLISVILYVIIPLVAGIITRKILSHTNTTQDEHTQDDNTKLDSFVHKLKPFSIAGLLLMVVLLFGFQAHTIINKPMIIVLIAIPLLIQSYGIFALAYLWGYLWKVPHNISAPAGLIGTSNFFELAVAVAISLFGLHSGAAVATVVGVLVEVPVMLTLVAFANKTKLNFHKRTQ